MSAVDWAVLLVGLQRLAELLYAQRNAARLIAAGAVEHGAGHYPLLVLVHAGWLASLWLFVPDDAMVVWPWLGVYGALQAARLWIFAALGRFWTTRIITLSGAPLVERGPYRYCRHPNYLVVAAEIAILPLAFGAWQITLAFSILNAAVLAWRIRVEDMALAASRRGSPTKTGS